MVISNRMALLIGWMMVVTVFLLSLLPLSSPVGIVQGGDKLGHLLAYFGMTYWFLHLSMYPWRVLVLFLLMGAAIEVLQSLTDYRYFEWADLLANGIGVLVAYVVFVWAKLQLKFISIKSPGGNDLGT